MPRTMLTDIRWELLLQVMKSTGRIYDKTEHRMTFEGILYRMRTGVPWRDLPSEFGEWRGVKPNGTKTYYKDFLPMSMGALNAITMKIKMQYYKRSYWNILFRTKMKDARKNLIR